MADGLTKDQNNILEMEKKQVELHLETFRLSTIEQYRNLTTISTLSAALLVVASFSRQLSLIDTPLKVLITFLLLIIPIGTWGFYKNFSDGSEVSLKHIEQIIGSNITTDISELKAKSRKSLLSHVPMFINAVLTIVIVGLLILMWR